MASSRSPRRTRWCAWKPSRRSSPRELVDRVDPALQAARLANQDLRIAQRVREQRAALDAGHHRFGEVPAVPAAQFTELAGGPLQQPFEDRRGGAVSGGSRRLAQLAAQRPKRAAVFGDELALGRPVLDQAL